jgi:hypothetical protein
MGLRTRPRNRKSPPSSASTARTSSWSSSPHRPVTGPLSLNIRSSRFPLKGIGSGRPRSPGSLFREWPWLDSGDTDWVYMFTQGRVSIITGRAWQLTMNRR